MFMKKRPGLTALAILSLVAIFSLGSRTLGQTRKVTVNAQGSVDTKPDQLQFSVTLIRYGETSKKAKDDFDELRKEFLSAFNVMKFKGLAMRSTSKSLGLQTQPGFGGPGGGAPPIAFGGGGMGGGAMPAAAEPQHYATETFQMTVDGIDKMSSEAIESLVVNLNKELKRLKLSTSTGFSTFLKSQTPFLKKAYAKAMEEARFKAEGLAELSNAKVGKVIEIAENSNYIQPLNVNPYGMSAMPISYGPAIGSGISSKQTIMVSLKVTFELTD